MFQEQLDKVKAETKEIGEVVERARRVIEELSKEGVGGADDDGKRNLREGVEGSEKRGVWNDRRVWEVLEKEMGGI